MATDAKLTGAVVFKRKQALRMKEHRKAIQMGLAYAMSETRRRAGDTLIPNNTGTVNPYVARRKQPSTPGKLTNRTSKLMKMLKYGTNASNPLNSWDKSTLGKPLYKEKKNIGLKGQIRSSPLGSGRGNPLRAKETHRATYRVHINSHPFLFNTSGGQPTETVQTLAIRFNWETGIRGQTRPYFAPVIKLTEFDMKQQVKLKDNMIWSK